MCVCVCVCGVVLLCWHKKAEKVCCSVVSTMAMKTKETGETGGKDDTQDQNEAIYLMVR